MPFPLSIWLVHPERSACDAFATRFSDLPDVRVVQSTFEQLEPHDAFVTAGNAFGIMTAGIDAAVVRVLGPDMMRQVQERIQDEFLGEQPVGTAMILPTESHWCRFIVHAPTMRVPGSISGTDKVYCATWAASQSTYRHNVLHRDTNQQIRTLALPAMGTGFGGMSYDECARQMAAAYSHYLRPPARLDWDTVIERHKAISYDGDRQVPK
jgi:O-acetyl-ADP-ribose deacetylase (regulator of RNase III)